MSDNMKKLMLPPQTGYELAPRVGLFGVFVPEETYNLFTFGSLPSGSVLSNSTILPDGGYGSLRFDWEQGRRSASAIAVDSDQVIGGVVKRGVEGIRIPVQLVAGQCYTFSADIIAPANNKFDIYWTYSNDDYTRLTERSFCSTGFWQRDDVYGTFRAPYSGYYHIHLRCATPETAKTWYIDGLQFEEKPYPTSYVYPSDTWYYPGDIGYEWTGAPFASSSHRPWWSRAGGRLVRLKDFGFRVKSFKGLGMVPNRHIYSPYSQLHGAYHQRRRWDRRSFTITGQFMSRDLGELEQQRYELQRLFMDNDLYRSDPVVLRYQNVDANGNPIGREMEFYVRLIDGLDSDSSSSFGEDVTMKFTCDEPFAHEPGAFGVMQSVSGNVSTVSMTFQSPVDAPAYGWIGIQAGSGKLLKIENKTNRQWIDLVHTFVPGEYLQLCSEFIYNDAKTLKRVGTVETDIISEIAPGSSLPIWSAVPRSKGYDGTNELVFTFDPNITTSLSIYVHYARSHYSADVACSDLIGLSSNALL